MGGNNSKPKPQVSRTLQEMTCSDDLICQNIDSRRSVPGQDPVLVCPDAKCQEGKCVCGPGCVKDPYLGICCKSIETEVIQTPMGEQINTYCVEGPDKMVDNIPKKNGVNKSSGFSASSQGSKYNPTNMSSSLLD